MTAAVLKRGAAPPKRRPVRAPARQTRRVAPATVSLPVDRRTLIRRTAIVFVALLAAAGVVLAALAGVPQRARDGFIAWTAKNGFEVHHVEITGNREMGKLPVFKAAFPTPTDAMLATDIGAIRARLRALPWVADASVSRRLPDGLAIDIVERRPVALWQSNHRLVAVDPAGVHLTGERLDRFARLPVVVGPGADTRVGEALALLAEQPRLAAKSDAATLIAHRRWDIKFRTGEVLMLPEGQASASKAFRQFARLDAQGEGLTGRGFDRFDLRLPGKMLVRGPEVVKALAAQAKAEKAAQAAAKAAAKAQVPV